MWLAGDSKAPEVVVVGVPNSKSSVIPSRADLAPLSLRSRLQRFSTFDSEHQREFGSIRVRDMGNWAISELDRREMPHAVKRLASELPSESFHLLLGGDNAITRPLVNAHGPDLSDVGLITLDAHHDLGDLENGPNNANPTRGLIEEDGLPATNVVQLGIHSFANSSQDRSFAETTGVTTITVSEIESDGMTSVADSALSSLDHCSTIHVDVDIGVLDQAFAPGCRGSAPGGLSVRQLADGVRACAVHPRVASIDFVEVDPTLDTNSRTIDVMAHLILTAVSGFSRRSPTQAYPPETT